MKIKKSSKKRKENYGSFQPVGDIDRYNSSLFIEIRKPYAYLHGQAYKPLIFVYVTDALIMHAAICKGEQEDVIHKASMFILNYLYVMVLYSIYVYIYIYIYWIIDLYIYKK